LKSSVIPSVVGSFSTNFSKDSAKKYSQQDTSKC